MSRVIEVPAPIGRACLHIIDGQVLYRQDSSSFNVRTETTGGGGYVHPTYGGYVSAPKTVTTVSQSSASRIWIEESDGTRHQVSLIGPQCRFPAAAGHRVRLVKGGAAGKTEPTVMWLRNNTVGEAINFESDDLWSWARSHRLVRYPLLYRVLFSWSPFLVAAYLMLYWAPLTEFWQRLRLRPRTRSVGDFLQGNLEGLSQWSPSIVWDAYASQDAGFWVGFVIAGIGLLLVWQVFELVGYLTIGWWWRALVQRPFRNRVVDIYTNDRRIPYPH